MYKIKMDCVITCYITYFMFLMCICLSLICMVTLATVVNTTVRSAFEYQGQKCSACSRMYVPDTLWPQVWYPVFGVCDIHDGTFGVV